MDDEGGKPFSIERAKTGRAACRACRTVCVAGELRMAKLVASPYGDNKFMKTWHHVDCLMNLFMKQRPTTKRITSTAEIENFENLSPDDKTLILLKLNDMEVQYSKKHNSSPVIVKECDELDDEPSTSNVVTKKADTIDVSHRDSSFQEFQNLCRNVAKDSKHTSKMMMFKQFFTEGSDRTGFKSDISVWIKLLAPSILNRVYNLKDRQLLKIFARLLRVDRDDMMEDLNEGNVGETLKNFFNKSIVNPASVSTLTVFEIDEFLNALTALTKEEEQFAMFRSIIHKCTAEDLKYLIYLIIGDLRMGAKCKYILDALEPGAYEEYRSKNDIDIILSNISIVKKHGTPTKKSTDADLQVMTPVSPMLAEACKSIEMAMKKCPNGMMSEIKYDGERVQVHKSNNVFQYFSRSLKPVMKHKIQHLKDYIPKAFPHANDMILDSEILMVDTTTGQLLPFGSLGVHKKSEFEHAQECLFVFDCIFYNGESLTNKSIRERRRILENNMVEIKNRIMYSKVEVIYKSKQLQEMMCQVFELGLEGLVLKDLESKYEPGKRHWLKVKKDYLLDGAMADSADLVVLGAWFGSGKKGGMLSVFLMGCYDQSKNQWLTVTKVSGGHDDDTLASLQDPLMNNMTKISQDMLRVPSWFKCTKKMVPDFVANDPKKQPVWEITGAEFSQADIHTAGGISIRFPRVTKIRNDKSWESATSFAELKILFENSKQKTDYSHLFKNTSDSDIKINPGKRKIINDDLSISKRQKNIVDFLKSPSKASPIKGSPSKVVTIKNPLPDVFHSCVLLFFKSELSSEINRFKRYWIAYGGSLDESDDGSEATHVIHSVESISVREYYESKWDTSKLARHVTLEWLKLCVESNEIVNTAPYAVRLTN
ncbi:DNA ligase 3 [Arctopsyche grandis]|uniref:DNA ligase 3 n=1 Tax=Arctopsyche grandis TaxID=121162 RepID=UPI00406D88B0